MYYNLQYMAAGGNILLDFFTVPMQSAITASVLFDPLHGTSTPSATFRILGRQGKAIHQVINVMGRVRSCTPTGGVAGYPNC